MKEIKSIFRPFKLNDVVMELLAIDGLPGMTISEVKRYGRGSSQDYEKGIGNGLLECVSKMKVEIVVPDELVQSVVSAIQKTAHTGNTGDGKIYVIPVDDVIVIRTNGHLQ